MHLVRFLQHILPGPSKGMPAGYLMRRKNSDVSSLEQANLLAAIPPAAPQDQATVDPTKGRCWCCWETAETPQDPLIRVCRGCKDPDLQWIHQSCVDSYLSALPPSSDIPEIDTPRPDTADVADQRIADLEAGIALPDAQQEFMFDTDSGFVFPPTNLVASPAAVRASNTVEAKRIFKCTRCSDPYNVQETEISRFYIILTDTHLRTAFLIMLVCMIIITWCSVSIMREHWGSSRLVINVGDEGTGGVRVKVDTVAFSAVILFVSWWFAAETCYMIWVHAAGRMKRKIVGCSS
ncbi:hypothetical protein HDU98_007628 [Podochytrium sp. JEL0797]|nr:hypothetical protein HDU98_007628 [Podochytrium sp. JEL0797]